MPSQQESMGIPVYLEKDDPLVLDPSTPTMLAVWQGANAITFKLLVCVEAIRDLSQLLGPLASSEDPFSNRRIVKQLASPLYALATGIRAMFNELQSNAKEYPKLPPSNRKDLAKTAKTFEKHVPLGKDSPLKTVRDKLSAHIDKETVQRPSAYWDMVDLGSSLEWLGDCVKFLRILLPLEVYGWTRDSGDPKVWSLMSVDGTLVDMYLENKKPKRILRVSLAKSPKYAVAEEINSLYSLYITIQKKKKDISA